MKKYIAVMFVAVIGLIISYRIKPRTINDNITMINTPSRFMRDVASAD